MFEVYNLRMIIKINKKEEIKKKTSIYIKKLKEKMTCFHILIITSFSFFLINYYLNLEVNKKVRERLYI